ncbi:MAG: hypothetical protein ACT4QG_09350 [Sporichthyaceae bacterium]
MLRTLFRNRLLSVLRFATADADPDVVGHLEQACRDFGADPVERLALFEAGIVASRLQIPGDETDDRVGVLGQNGCWGKAAARRDPYTAATVFLREARRLRTGPNPPRSASRLASRVQGRGATWAHAAARRAAIRVLAPANAVDTATWRLPAPASRSLNCPIG